MAEHCDPNIVTRTLRPEHRYIKLSEALTQRLDNNASSYTPLTGVNHTPTMPNLGDQP